MLTTSRKCCYLLDKKAQLTQGLRATALTRDSAVIPRWPSAAVLDFIEPVIWSADPKNPCLEPNMEWIGCTVCEIFTFKLYCDLETRVWGHSRSSKTAPFDRAHMTLYSPCIVTMPLSIPFPRYSRVFGENSWPRTRWAQLSAGYTVNTYSISRAACVLGLICVCASM